jgi:hypothetical protein
MDSGIGEEDRFGAVGAHAHGQVPGVVPRGCERGHTRGELDVGFGRLEAVGERLDATADVR